MFVVALSRRLRTTQTHRLLHPRHVMEVAEALVSTSQGAAGAAARPELAFAPADIRVSCTSLGIRISTDMIKDAGAEIHHYALSGRDVGITEPVARVLLKLICLLRHPDNSAELIEGSQSVFHVLVRRTAC